MGKSLVLLWVSFVFIASAGAAGIEVHGHRGARAIYPENTLAAFDYALKVGVDALELDTAVTKDNQVVVTHDLKTNPMICLRNGKPEEAAIRLMTLQQVKEFDCGSLKHPGFPKQQAVPGEKMPTLEEVFELVKNSAHPAAKKVRFNIETKMVPGYADLSPTPREFARLMVALVRKHGLVNRTVVQSFDHRSLAEVKKIEPRIRIAPLISDNYVDSVAIAKGLRAEIISPDFNWITAESVEKLHRIGVKVIPWTLNDPAQWARAVQLRVDGIITDDPEALITYLANNKFAE